MNKKNIKDFIKKVAGNTFKVVRNNKEELFTLSVMSVGVVCFNDTTFASTTGADPFSGGSAAAFESIATPMKGFMSFFEGTVGKVAMTGGILVAGTSAYMGYEQQMGKKASGMLMSGGAILAAPGIINSLSGTSSGALM